MDHPAAEDINRRSSVEKEIGECQVIRCSRDLNPDNPAFLRAVGLLSTSDKPKQDVGTAPVSAAPPGADAVEVVVRAGGVCDDECVFLENLDDVRQRYQAAFPNSKEMTVWTYKTNKAGTTAAKAFPITSIRRSLVPLSPEGGRAVPPAETEGIMKWEIPPRSIQVTERPNSVPKDRSSGSGDFAYQFWCSWQDKKKSFFDYAWATDQGHFHWIPPPLKEFVGEDYVSAAAETVGAEAADDDVRQRTPIKEEAEPSFSYEDGVLRRRRPRCRRRRCPSDDESDIAPLV
jgi:hypothetical protein